MKKVILFLMLIAIVVVNVSAQSAKQDTLKGQELEVFTDALRAQVEFVAERDRIQKEYELLVEDFTGSDSILVHEFNKTKVFYYFIAMEKIKRNSYDDSGDTLIIREVYKEKDPVLKENIRDYNIWILKMKTKYLTNKTP